MANDAAAASQAAGDPKTASSSDPLTAEVQETHPNAPPAGKGVGNGEEKDGSEEDDTGLVQVESLCMNCHENVCPALPFSSAR